MSCQDTPESRIAIAETAAWLDLLYGKCSDEDGDILVVGSSKRRIIDRFPPSRKHLAAEVMQRHPGCYLKVNLMDYIKIRKRNHFGVGGINEVKTVVSFHLDVDAGKDKKYVSRRHALWAMAQMPVPPTLIVNSDGDTGGFHAYWNLRQPHRIVDKQDQRRIRDQAEAWNERLKMLCGGRLDKTCNLDRVLRCVGVPRKDGGRVCCEVYEPENEYELAELAV